MPYLHVSDSIRNTGARNIGLKHGEDDWEYPLWVLLKGKDGKLPRFEHIDVDNPSGAIALRDFQPDLIIIFDNRGYPSIALPDNPF
jgi:hypothetical protein